jgi:phage terminase large subunit GpA-like protein
LRRTDSYGNLKKILYVSTPKRKSNSQIEPLFNQGDKRYYNVQCPSCKDLHPFQWKWIHWEKDEDGRLLIEYDKHGNVVNDPVWHECPLCGYHMHNHEKPAAMAEEGYGGHAKWIPTKKQDRPGLKSWHLNGLYGFRSWLDIVIEFQDAKDDNHLLEDFICDTLAETWEEKIDKPDEHYLSARAESDWQRGDVPEGVNIITIGVDVQGDRLEAQVVGWGNRKEAWSIDYHIFNGIPDEIHDECWNELDELIKKVWYKRDGTELRAQICLIDAPHSNASVMQFCERFPWNPRSWVGVYPTFGRATLSAIVKEHESTIKTPEILMHDQLLKQEIYVNLKRKVPAAGHSYPPGFIHFPIGYNEEYYKQLTSEEIEEIINNKGVSTFIIHNKKQRRNESLDTMKMALAGVYYIFVKYFELWNNTRKNQRRTEIKPDWNIFWAQFGHDSAEDEDIEK